MLYDFFELLAGPGGRKKHLARWAGWTLMTAIGWGVAGWGGLPVGRAVVVEGSTAVIVSVALNMALLGGLIGALIGVSQGLYLRHQLRNVWWWIPATGLGWGVGLPVAMLLNLLAGLGLSAALYGVFIGVSVGFAQWLVLNREFTPARRWVWANVVGLPLGVALAGTVERTLLQSTETQGGFVGYALFAALVAGLVVGLITGVPMVVMLQRRERGEA